MSQTAQTAVAVIGIDIGKNAFHIVGHDERGAIVLRQSATITSTSSGTRACPQLEDSQADYRVIHRRSADSELTDAPLWSSG